MMKSEKKWIRQYFSREMPLEDSPLTASFEIYDVGVVGIHITGCFMDGLISEDALEIINRFSSRTEYDETGKGVYILVEGEMPYFDGYSGLQIETYYLTGKTIWYEKIIRNQEALEWFVKEHGFFMRDRSDFYVDERYYRQISMDGDILKISLPNVKKGTRHQTLLYYGGKLLSQGMDISRVEIKMYDFNMLYCIPPLPFDEFKTILKSVIKYSDEV